MQLGAGGRRRSGNGQAHGPPTRIGAGCRYPVAPDSALLARKTQLRDVVKQIPGANDSAAIRDTLWNKAAVIVIVDVGVSGVGNRVEKYSEQFLTAVQALKSANGDSGQATKPEGWDAAQGSYSTFEGRIGHVRVTVRERGTMSRPLVLFEKKVALAARVRDRIPDLPFANPNASVAAAASPGPDPCSIITRPEAEAVLGPLVVEPYRVGEPEPFAGRERSQLRLLHEEPPCSRRDAVLERRQAEVEEYARIRAPLSIAANATPESFARSRRPTSDRSNVESISGLGDEAYYLWDVKPGDGVRSSS